MGNILNTGNQSEPPMSLEDLRIMLYKHFKVLDPQQVPVCIQGEPTVPYYRVIEVVQLLQSLNVQPVGLLELILG